MELFASGAEEEDSLSAFDCDSTGATAYIGIGKGKLLCIDLRAGKVRRSPLPHTQLPPAG